MLLVHSQAENIIDSTPPSSVPFSILVVELSDGCGPRRRPDRPNLYVGVIQGDPHRKFDQIKKSKRGHPTVRRFGLCVRDDLTPKLTLYTTSTEDAIERAKKRLIIKLKRRAYRVNGTLTVWHVYVIELNDTVGPRKNPGLPWVYVGQTSIDVEERYRQHVEGSYSRKGRIKLSTPATFGHSFRLRPDLYKHEPTYFTKGDAEKAEAELAERLKALGYSVKGGH